MRYEPHLGITFMVFLCPILSNQAVNFMWIFFKGTRTRIRNQLLTASLRETMTKKSILSRNEGYNVQNKRNERK